ncbi:MAG: acetyl-CoA carboxylase biotin carboxyl carrier protein [Parvibaculales bacterium]
MAKLPESKLIKELAELLEETQLSEIEIETDGTRIRVARQFSVQSAPMAMPASPAPASAPAPAPASESGASSETTQAAGAIKAPMVGTAYLFPEPGTPAFVNIGDTVQEGQTLLIIEAMKTMNPITAPQSGKVTQIIVTNEQPVEFDEVLMIIES